MICTIQSECEEALWCDSNESPQKLDWTAILFQHDFCDQLVNLIFYEHNGNGLTSWSIEHLSKGVEDNP